MGAIRFGPYLLLERINAGGMAEVWKARPLDPAATPSLVAVKRLHPSVASDDELVRMFRDEAAICARLRHPNLVFACGRFADAGVYGLAVEYVDGRDLRAVQQRLARQGARMPPRLAAAIVARVCRGLDFAHRCTDEAGLPLHVVHRDVSPQNVLLARDGAVKLADFGLARARERLARTRTGVLKGKLGYMSPEQVRARPVDARSDVFGAGVVLHELCTGARLFDGPTGEAVMARIEAAQVSPPSRSAPGVPAQLDAIALRALARDPADRFPSAAAMADALDACLPEPVTDGELAAFLRETFAEAAQFDAARTLVMPVPALARRSRSVALALVAALLAAGVAAALVSSRTPAAQSPASR